METFPHISYKIGHYWVGYYSSRPNFKKLIKDLSFQVSLNSQILAFELLKLNKTANDHAKYIKNVNKLKKTYALMMHHDTITGTSVQDVIND